MGSPAVKRAIVPKRGAFMFADYKSIEPRLTAYYAAKIGFPEFAEQIVAGVDPYTAVAQLVTGKSKITDKERDTWKRAYLSLLYGGGVKTIQLQFDNSYTEARNMIRTFHDNWPAVRALQDSIQGVHARRGFVKSIGGRHLHMEENGEHKLLNKLIQGGAADIMIDGLLNMYRWLRTEDISARMVSVIHDEVIYDAPEDELPYLAEHITALMDYPLVSEVVPIQVDLEVSTTSWADKISYEEWKESHADRVLSEGQRRAAGVL